MDIWVHNMILWQACVAANKRGGLVADPREYFPLMARGSWLNDTNQATLFTDLPDLTSDPRTQRFFRDLWKHDSDDLLGDMHNGPSEAKEIVEAAAKKLAPAADYCDDFGSYDPRDHLDILKKDDTDSERLVDDHWRPRTIKRSVEHVCDRFQIWWSAEPENRLKDWSKASTLGRALHTIEDFYAHSNYVELLLWSLRPYLDPEIVEDFNASVQFFESAPYERCYCPLPPLASQQEEEYRRLTSRNTMFWYNKTPADTPLVSTVCLLADTACWLLDMCSAYLERTDGGEVDKEDLSMLMAVFNVPGRPLVVTAWKIYEAYREFLEAIGNSVRNWLADWLQAKAETLAGSEGIESAGSGVFGAASRVIRQYDNAEAADWARAGRLRYVLHSIQRDMARELFRDGDDAAFRLPHHALLHKDHPFSYPDDAARFRLACVLATQVTTELLCWAFSRDCDSDIVLREILDRYIRHPHLQVGAKDQTETAKRLAVLASECTNHRWSVVARKGGLDP